MVTARKKVPLEATELFNILADGVSELVLAHTPIPGTVSMLVNGTVQWPVIDYSVLVTALTWNSFDFVLGTHDRVEVTYEYFE